MKWRSDRAVSGGVIGAALWVWRGPMIEASFHPGRVSRARVLMEILFYGLFAMVVTSSVRIAGVLLVFSYLIVPAVCANFLARNGVDQVRQSTDLAARVLDDQATPP